MTTIFKVTQTKSVSLYPDDRFCSNFPKVAHGNGWYKMLFSLKS